MAEGSEPGWGARLQGMAQSWHRGTLGAWEFLWLQVSSQHGGQCCLGPPGLGGKSVGESLGLRPPKFTKGVGTLPGSPGNRFAHREADTSCSPHKHGCCRGYQVCLSCVLPVWGTWPIRSLVPKIPSGSPAYPGTDFPKRPRRSRGTRRLLSLLWPQPRPLEACHAAIHSGAGSPRPTVLGHSPCGVTGAAGRVLPVAAGGGGDTDGLRPQRDAGRASLAGLCRPRARGRRERGQRARLRP